MKITAERYINKDGTLNTCRYVVESIHRNIRNQRKYSRGEYHNEFIPIDNFDQIEEELRRRGLLN